MFYYPHGSIIPHQEGRNKLAGRLAYEKCQSLPIKWIHESKTLLEISAGCKAENKLSLAEAWIMTSAIQEDDILVQIAIKNPIKPFKMPSICHYSQNRQCN